MTITQDKSAPLVAVVGATGVQGGSVILALSESKDPYRIRGFTRDTNKETAQKLSKDGVEMIAVNLTVENKEKVFEAFQGADFAFAVTNYWEHMTKDREVAEGKMLIDAANAAKVRLIAWSGLSSIVKNTNGKYRAPHFDGKEEVTEYARTLVGGVPVVDVQAGIYMQNYKTMMAPKKEADGSFKIIGVGSGEMTLPLIDAVLDYGLFIRRAIEGPKYERFSTICVYGEELSKDQMAQVLATATGKDVKYTGLTEDQLVESFRANGWPEPMVRDVQGVHCGTSEAGYYGKHDVTHGRDGLARAPVTWAEFVKREDWSEVLQ
ncbi:hypothetical protein FRB96_000574 [Tulasnella sp. 330]|nr:hypothetical protein FRB96_000574 [Tulasnella sp. 330]